MNTKLDIINQKEDGCQKNQKLAIIKFIIPTRTYLSKFIDKEEYNFNQRYDYNSSELKYPMWGERDGMKIKITEKVIEISGS